MRTWFRTESSTNDPVQDSTQTGEARVGAKAPHRKRRILILIENLPAPFDRRVWQEATTLRDAGYEIEIICPTGKGYESRLETIDGIMIHRFDLPTEGNGPLGYLIEYGAALFWFYWLSLSIFMRRGFDAVHACNPPDLLFLVGGLYKMLFRTKFVYDHHDINPELYEAKFGRRDRFWKLMIWLERRTFRLADISIATNESYRRIAIERGGMDPNRVFVVRSGPNLDRLRICPPNPALRHGKDYLVGYVGVMGQQEGIDLLLDAAKYIVQTLGRTDIHFCLVGGGTALEAMKILAVDLGLADYVTFTGRVPDQLLLEVLNTADVCVNPDVANEMNDKSTMNKIMEYMALAKPIVQFDLTEGRVSAGAASLYADHRDPGDLARKIVALIDDPEARARMGALGRVRVETELEWRHEVPKLLAAYEQLFFALMTDRNQPRQNKVGKLQWYYRRLAAMSPAEIFSRFVETAKRRYDRAFSARLVPPLRDLGPIGVIPNLAYNLASWTIPPTLLAEWAACLAETRSGRFELLGCVWPACERDRRWHFDPVSSAFWPSDRYCYDIDYRHRADRGDIKFAWELNRLQHLQPIAALAFKQKDQALAEFCWAEVDSWIAHNPPHLGVNWSSGIELALRAVSLLVINSLLDWALDSEHRARLWRCLGAHALWLERYPSRFSSANNHLVAEGLGLFAIGTLCPALDGAERWVRHGWQILSDEIARQILPDGVGAEQTPSYAAVVLEMFLLGAHIASASGVPVPVGYNQRLILGGEWLRWLMDDSGEHIHLGDNDNARVIGVYRRDETYVRSMTGCIAAYAGRGDLVPPQLEPHLRQAIFGQPPAPAPGPVGVRMFGDGGYTVGRHETPAGLLTVAIDHGPLGYLSIAAHGHADALSVWLSLGKQPILVDAGTYLYHSGGAWRSYFRGTAAHNTLAIDGTDSSIMAGNFNWSHKAQARVLKNEKTAEFWQVEAEHDGYRGRFGVVHRRYLSVEPPRLITIRDRLIGTGTHEVAIGFLLHPDLIAAASGDGIAVMKPGGPVLMTFEATGPLACSIASPPDSQAGFVSTSFNIKRPATMIRVSGRLPHSVESVVTLSLGPS